MELADDADVAVVEGALELEDEADVADGVAAAAMVVVVVLMLGETGQQTRTLCKGLLTFSWLSSVWLSTVSILDKD